jgi:hypothetical protein
LSNKRMPFTDLDGCFDCMLKPRILKPAYLFSFLTAESISVDRRKPRAVDSS